MQRINSTYKEIYIHKLTTIFYIGKLVSFLKTNKETEMSRNIYRLLKILHLIGLSLFLGSIFGHIVASMPGGAPQAGNEAAFLTSRVHITAATR